MPADPSDEKLIDLIQRSREGGDPADDILRAAPGLTVDDAFRLQIGLKRRIAQKGDPLVGYRISMTSRHGVQESVNLGILPPEALKEPPSPVFTSLSESNLGDSQRVIKRDPHYMLFAEAEVAVVMAKRLQGPNATPAEARHALGGLFAGFDMAQIPINSPYSFQHKVASACAPVDTQIVLGARVTDTNIDLRLEGVLVSIDGEARASATAWEALGDPINAIVFLANKLAQFGEALEPGQIVITGVCPYPQRIYPGESLATAEFTRLGTVTARVSA